MKKFGFGKKGDDGDDANRSALFGRKKSSPASQQSDNPCAQPSTGPDPYADAAKYANMTPYQQARRGLDSSQRFGPSPSGPQDNGPGGGNNYEAPRPSGYGSDRYGSGGGYGSSRYGAGPVTDCYSSSTAMARGPGGYGGFGGATDTGPDENRDALFSDAQQRYAQKQQRQQQPRMPGATSDPYNHSGNAGGSYGGYGEQKELTAEEQEDAEYQAILSEKRQLQQESVSSVSRSVQIARQANEVGQATLARLGAQGERLHNTEKNLDLAANQNKVAQDRAAELKTLNRSMFAVHVGNPFTSKQRREKADEDVLNRHRAERDQREATRRDGYQANQRLEDSFKSINNAPGAMRSQARKKDYGKFNLEDEEGADELEDQIDDGLAELENQVSMMNMAGRAIGREVETQNKQIDRIMLKSDAVDDATRMNRERLARIR